MWAVELGASAAQARFGFERRDAEVVSFNLFRLAEDPRAMSHGNRMRRGMDYVFRRPGASRVSWFRIRWQFKRDEILFIFAIEREEGPRPPTESAAAP